MFCYGHPEGAKEGSGWVIPKPDEFLTPIGLSIVRPSKNLVLLHPFQNVMLIINAHTSGAQVKFS